MKRIALLLVAIAIIAGCTYPWVRNPATGEIPIVQGITDAVGPALSGNWIGALITLVAGTTAGCFATKLKKDGQIKQIVKAVEEFKVGEKQGVDVLLGLFDNNMSDSTKGLVKKIIGTISNKET